MANHLDGTRIREPMTELRCLLVKRRGQTRLRHEVRASCHFSALIATALWALACSRSALEPGDLDATDDFPTPTATVTQAPDAGPPRNDAGGVASSGGSSSVTECAPSAEVCNGVDDDCNQRVDDLPPLPCPGGGFSYCVAGKQSACPSRCEACIPGAERVCFTSYCTFWGTQTCTADGRSFGACRERAVPSECKNAAGREGDIANLERCCIDNGYCCVDSRDLDQDGDRSEMLGRCDDVICH
ncbi:MAG: hypothetical protein QM756_26650 [Polyangiaceae bacterium]